MKSFHTSSAAVVMRTSLMLKNFNTLPIDHEHHIFIKHDDPACFIWKSTDHKSTNCTSSQELVSTVQQTKTDLHKETSLHIDSNYEESNSVSFGERLEEALMKRDKKISDPAMSNKTNNFTNDATAPLQSNVNNDSIIAETNSSLPPCSSSYLS